MAGNANADWYSPAEGTYMDAIGFQKGSTTVIGNERYYIARWFADWNNGNPTESKVTTK